MKIIRLLQLSDVHWTKQLDSADNYTDIRDQMLQDLEYYCNGTGNSFDKILRLYILVHILVVSSHTI